jgi:hypothetical protein
MVLICKVGCVFSAYEEPIADRSSRFTLRESRDALECRQPAQSAYTAGQSLTWSQCTLPIFWDVESCVCMACGRCEYRVVIIWSKLILRRWTCSRSTTSTSERPSSGTPFRKCRPRSLSVPSQVSTPCFLSRCELMTLLGYFPQDAAACDQYLRHKSFIISPTMLAKEGVHVNMLVHNQNEFVITYPRGYHAGFNLGFNCAESVNFALESWLELGRRAKVCQCVSHRLVSAASSQYIANEPIVSG